MQHKYFIFNNFEIALIIYLQFLPEKKTTELIKDVYDYNYKLNPLNYLAVKYNKTNKLLNIQFTVVKR